MKEPDLTVKADDAAYSHTEARDTSLNLNQRMLLVMEHIGYIPKEGTGPEAQGSYKFARVEHIKDRVRDELVAHGVMVHVSMDGRDIQVLTGQGRDGTRTAILATVWGSMTFVNVDDPTDVVSGTIHGQGIDSQDKAVSKATTSADKYGLLNAFQIPTGKDPDEDGQEVPQGSGQTRTGSGAARPAQRPSGGTGPGNEANPFDPSEGQQPARQDYPAGDDSGLCPRHRKPWRAGKNGGWFCPTKDGDSWCSERPDKAWSAAHER